MKIHFFKYQATGNDFVIIDNRDQQVRFSTEQIQLICDRKFGIGADGLMLIEGHPSADFLLTYYNSDGSQSLCGNGSRAAVTMAIRLGIVRQTASFEAYDGLHEAQLLPNSQEIRLKMNDVSEVKAYGSDYFIHTGSPHYIRFVDDVANFPVVEEGRKLRYSELFQPGGTNVNFVQRLPDGSIFVRTYERGVEDETLSCGTGVTACALAASLHSLESPVRVKTKGGHLSVEFKSGHYGLSVDRSASASPAFTSIFLVGPAKMVFEGDLEL